MPPGVILMLCPLGQLRSDIVRDAKASVAAERINASSRQIGHRYFLSVGGVGDAIRQTPENAPAGSVMVCPGGHDFGNKGERLAGRAALASRPGLAKCDDEQARAQQHKAGCD